MVASPSFAPALRQPAVRQPAGHRWQTSDFAVGTQATAASGGYLLLDNHGSLYTGRTRLSGSADWNSPSSRVDRLTASGMVSDRSGLLNGRLAYSGLIRSDCSRAEVALARTQYELGQTFAALNASGTADALELNLSHPLKRTRNRSIEATLGTSYRALRERSPPPTPSPRRQPQRSPPASA